MKESKIIFIINILKNIIDVYFDTFFVLYFLEVANYEILPLAKYYITLYLFIGIGFLLIRRSMKKNIKVPYFRIGISLQAIYITLIMLLKDNLISYVFLIGIIKGIADGFYHFPKNILNTEKITNEARQKFSGLVKIINKLFSIIIPLCLGVLLTFFSYTSLGKIFFSLFIIMFILSFKLKDTYYTDKKFELKRFFKFIKKESSIRNSLLVPFLAGFTYSSGVLGLIITLAKINNFKTNLNLGFVDSICSALSLFVSLLFTIKIKNKDFKKVIIPSGIISFSTILLFAFYPTKITLIFYLLARFSCVLLIELIADNVTTNLTNTNLKKEFKAEYYCLNDIMYAISRVTGYLILLVVCLFNSSYINYILIISALSLLIEALIVGKLTNNK
ncbi:MAG: MFS transporter [Ruminococcus sp.]|nr:MFS transporter [Ruminococcus sp.]